VGRPVLLLARPWVAVVGEAVGAGLGGGLGPTLLAVAVTP